MNKITKIEKVDNMKAEKVKKIAKGKDYYSNMEGYVVNTENDTIYVLIENESQCCEQWGYFSTEDSMDDFVGANLLDIELTDTLLETKSVTEETEDLDRGGIQFVTFKTTEGTFQLAVYNSHNGYYGHFVLVIKNGKIIMNDYL